MKRTAIIVSIALWGLILGAVSAFAQPKTGGPLYAYSLPVKINVLAVVSKLDSTGQAGPLSMPRQLQRKVTRVGIKRVQAKGINIAEGTFKQVADPFPENRFGTDLAVIFREFSAWYSRVQQLKLLKPRTVTHVLAPPFVVEGFRYIGGAAFVCSAPRGGYSYSNAVEFNSRGASRVVHSIHGVMHEILHAVGAYHSDAAGNVMHPDALSQIEAQIQQGGKRRLTILNETRAQVHRCIGK